MTCCNDKGGFTRIIPPYAGFTAFTSSIPKLYWGVKSQEQRILALCKELDKLICYADMLGKTEDETQTMLEELIAQFEQFKESGFEDYYLAQIEAWVNSHVEELYRLLVKQVYFGLTSTGYFCAYIPESWSDIEFDTGMQYGRFDYGRLILRFNADGSGVIDNTGRYDDASTDGILANLDSLNRRVTHNENTLYTELYRG